MLINCIKIPKYFFIFICIITILVTSIGFYFFANSVIGKSSEIESDEKNNFIKWVDFKVTCSALEDTSSLDISSHTDSKNNGVIYNWIELLAYLACKNGGNFKNYKKSDLDDLVNKLENNQSMDDLTANLKFFDYYYESFSAILGRFYW